MSYRYSGGGSGDSRRYSSSSSRRDSSPPRHRSSRRSPSPGPSRSRREEQPAARDPRSLPEQFGRGDGPKPAEDDSNILQRMKTHYLTSPLSDLYDCIQTEKKVKIWTRNFKEVRGVMTGYLIAFDKHWNVVLRDVDEVYLKPKKSKTPFLREIAPNEALQEIPAKVPRQKKDPPPEPPKPKEDEGGKKKKTRRKKAKSTSAKRQIAQLFVRGDNIVMVCPFDEDEQAQDDEEEEEQMEGEESQNGSKND